MPQQGSTPKNQTLGLLIALAILMTVGFLVLSFKIDLDATLRADQQARVSLQFDRLQTRLDDRSRSSAGGVAGGSVETSWDWQFFCKPGVQAVRVCGDYVQLMTSSTDSQAYEMMGFGALVTCPATNKNDVPRCKAIPQTCEAGSMACPMPTSVGSQVARPNPESPRTGLEAFVPDACPPSGEYPETRVVAPYELTELSCGDSGSYYSSTLVRNASDHSDVVAFITSNRDLQWELPDGTMHELTAVGDPPFESFTEFGGDQPATVMDLALDGVPLKLGMTPLKYADGGLGGLQGMTFSANVDYTGGTLASSDGQQFIIDFASARVTRK